MAAVCDERQQRLSEEVNAFKVNVDQSVGRRFGCLLDESVITVAGTINEVIEVVALPGFAQCGPQPFGEELKAVTSPVSIWKAIAL